jgi:hypothetical protein
MTNPAIGRRLAMRVGALGLTGPFAIPGDFNLSVLATKEGPFLPVWGEAMARDSLGT